MDINSEVIDLLSTEQVNPLTADLDLMETIEMVKVMNRLDMEVPRKVGEQAESIAQAVDLVVEHFQKGGRLIYVGAGTSGRLGILDATECPPTFGVDSDKVTCVMAGGRNAMFSSAEAKEDDVEQAKRDLEAFGLQSADVIMAIASSGRTPYCIGALTYAKEIGAGRISLSCNKGAKISPLAQVSIEVDTGAEVISGSTRLRAGTSQKLILNMISTLAMVKTGRVYGNLMVCMRPTNSKLSKRAIRVFIQATGNPDEERAQMLLNQAGGDIRTAIVMEKTGLNFSKAKALLDQNDGFIRKALQSFGVDDSIDYKFIMGESESF